MSNIDSTLNERGSRYGDFEDHAFITQDLKVVMQETPNWDLLKADQKEALEMTAHKIGRILNGDPNYIDSWHDIIGYIRLVEQRLEREQAPKSNFADALGKAFAAAAADINPEPKSDAQLGCGCLACELRRKVESAFGPGVEVIILTEESGDTD
jgi:hypothetical protein